jgi:hypothetical protein
MLENSCKYLYLCHFLKRLGQYVKEIVSIQDREKKGFEIARSHCARRRAAVSRGLLVSRNNNNNLDLPEHSNDSNLTE